MRNKSRAEHNFQIENKDVQAQEKCGNVFFYTKQKGVNQHEENGC